MNNQWIKPTLNLRPYAHSAPMIVGACIQKASASGWPDARIAGLVLATGEGQHEKTSPTDHAIQVAEKYFKISL